MAANVTCTALLNPIDFHMCFCFCLPHDSFSFSLDFFLYLVIVQEYPEVVFISLYGCS